MPVSLDNIRNFCVIAHIDAGKSTLADRFLELTKTIAEGKMRPQYLDMMDIERERGITIKMQPVRMLYKAFRGSPLTDARTDAEVKLLYEDITYKIRGAIFKVKNKIGLGHKESIYQRALEEELKIINLNFEKEKGIPIFYESKKVGVYRPDFIIDDKILVELKAQTFVGEQEKEQLWNYLRGSSYRLGLLVNFGGKDIDIKRIVYDTVRDQRQSALDPRESAQVEYILNLIDTPGHVDFSYEVSRSLAAVEGAILLVDATKGVQAQTIANLEQAQKQGLVIIPAINKIDLFTPDRTEGSGSGAQARINEVKEEITKILKVDPEKIFLISAKTGQGVAELLNRIVEKVPAPTGNLSKPFRALIFDSKFDIHKGVVAFIRAIDGNIKKSEKITLFSNKENGDVLEIGFFKPEMTSTTELFAGEIGYLATGIKEPGKVHVGDTVSLLQTTYYKLQTTIEPLPGYREPKPMVFASFYPENPDDFDLLKDALNKLKLSDASLFFESEAKEILGRGFRCGFLGLLHTEVTTERLTREFGLGLVISSPSVVYKIIDNKNKEREIYTAADWPEQFEIKEAREPWMVLRVTTPISYIGPVFGVLSKLSGKHIDTIHLSQEKVLISYEMPLREIITNLYENIKNATSGYASIDYQPLGYRLAQLVKLDILISGKKFEAFSKIVPEAKSFEEGRKTVQKLKQIMPRQLFSVPLQAAIGAKIIARETLSAKGKDVTAPLYGGDYTRKLKLLQKQKKGKKELKEKGQLHIPQKVFLDMLRS